MPPLIALIIKLKRFSNLILTEGVAMACNGAHQDANTAMANITIVENEHIAEMIAAKNKRSYWLAICVMSGRTY